MTDWVYDMHTRDTIGWSMIAITSICILTDLARLIFVNIKDLYWNIKKVNGKVKMKKEMKRRTTIIALQATMHQENGGTLNQDAMIVESISVDELRSHLITKKKYSTKGKKKYSARGKKKYSALQREQEFNLPIRQKPKTLK